MYGERQKWLLTRQLKIHKIYTLKAMKVLVEYGFPSERNSHRLKAVLDTSLYLNFPLELLRRNNSNLRRVVRVTHRISACLGIRVVPRYCRPLQEIARAFLFSNRNKEREHGRKDFTTESTVGRGAEKGK